MTPSHPSKKTLGPISANLITRLQKLGKRIFTLSEATQIYGKDKYATGDLLSELVKRDILARLKAGVYLILQTGEETAQLTNWPIIAREIAQPNRYFISHYAAMRVHGLTNHPLLDIYITMSVRRQRIKISGLNYTFIFCSKKYFLGGKPLWVNRQEQVQVSDLERTILDGLDRPELCGGLGEVVQGLSAKHQDLNARNLLKHAKKFRSKASVKRLGYILETFGWGGKIAGSLWNLIKDTKGVSLLNPKRRKEGRIVHRWRMQINVDARELRENIRR